MRWLYLFATLTGAWLTWNVYRPSSAGMRRSILTFLAGWLTGELALHHIVIQIVATWIFAELGGVAGWQGTLGILISLVSWTALFVAYRRSRHAAPVVDRALRSGLGEGFESEIPATLHVAPRAQVDWQRVALPLPVRHRDVERIRAIQYRRARGIDLELDVYRRKDRPTGCPAVLHIHGGGWVIGSRNEQGLPMVNHLASRGWVCFNVDYRLSPHATFPDHLIDLKHALAWIREHAHEYGADPNFVMVSGESAGGHLASMMALTANRPEYQPGFENVDTTLRACVSFYGVYDFTANRQVWPHRGLDETLERLVLKASLEEAPEEWRKASPIHWIRPDAPPFLVIHGDTDSLVPVDEARNFVAALRSNGVKDVAYAEIPGAQHAFELFTSWRTELVLHGVERFAALQYGRHLARANETRAA